MKWTPQALDDPDAVCLFIARDAPSFADIFAQRAFDATDRLTEFPESGRIVSEMNDPNLRERLIGNYRLVYRLRSRDVEILTGHHGARLIDTDQFPRG